MPDLWSVLHAPPIELLGWTLLHFVWQGILVAAVLAGVLYLLRNHSPRIRYVVGCAALFGILALPVATGMVLSERVLSAESPSSPSVRFVENGGEVAAMSPVPDAESSSSAAASWRTWVAGQVQPALPWIVVAWGVGVLGFAVRLGGGAWRVRRLRRSSRVAPDEWQDRLRGLADQMGVGMPVALRQSDRVESPVLAGWWRPVILVPAGFLSGLPPKQVEALLLHELAHVRRHDVLVGRLQAVVETLLFFHPATWWISRRVREVREACCDDLVVQAGRGRAVYAKALTALAERAVADTRSGWAPAAADGPLLHRIRRLVIPPEAPSTAGRRLSIVAAALLMVLAPAGVAACASQQSTAGAESPGARAAPEAEDAEEAPKAPLAPDALPDDTTEQRIAMLGPDSAERRLLVGPDRPPEVDSLDEDVYVIRTEDRADTIKVPLPEVLHGGLYRSFSPDSLERAIRKRINPDSLERVLRRRINSDSIERAVRLRFDPDSLEEHIYRADSLAQRFAQRFLSDWAEHWDARDVADSTFTFEFDSVDPDDFDWGDFGSGLDVDSLIRQHKHRADSLRHYFEQMRERVGEERSERLREQARRLRERAERLEKRAEKMEAPPTQEDPDAPQDTSDTSGRHHRDLRSGERKVGLAVSGRQYATWAQDAVERLDDTLRRAVSPRG